MQHPLVLPAPRARTASAVLAARVLGSAVLILAPFIFVLALKPLAYGIWFQTEPVIVGLFGCGAASWLALLLLDRAGHDLRPVLRNPAMRLLAAFVAWNALTTVFQALPGRSWLGSPESGEGVFAFLALLGMTALALTLWPWRPARLAMAAAAVCGAFTIGLLDAVLPHGSPWRPELFAAYAGIVGPPVFLIVAGAARRLSWRVLLAAFVAGLAPIAFSQNKTALLGCALGPAVYFVLRSRWVRRIRPAAQRRALAAAPILAVLMTVIAIAVCMMLPKWDALYSMRSRGLLALSAVQSIGDHLQGLLWGFGWGSFNDLLYQHTFLLWVHGYQNGVWDPNWEGVGAGGFHSHIDAFEAVLGGGLVSGALYLLVFCGVVAQARRAMLPAAAVAWFLVTVALSAWYPFMLCFPFLAVAIAACMAPLNEPRPAAAPLPFWYGAGPALAAVMLGFGAWATAQDAVSGGAMLAALNRQDAQDQADYRALDQDHGRGGVALWWCALNYASFIESEVSRGEQPSAGQVAWYKRLMVATDRWAARSTASVRLTAAAVALRDEIIAANRKGALGTLQPDATAGWSDAVLSLLRVAPARTDAAVPYLVWLATEHRYLPLLAFCERVFLEAPRDRVCRWYSGFALLQDPSSRAAGLQEMHAALQGGVNGIAPITAQTREAVNEEFAKLPHAISR